MSQQQKTDPTQGKTPLTKSLNGIQQIVGDSLNESLNGIQNIVSQAQAMQNPKLSGEAGSGTATGGKGDGK